MTPSFAAINSSKANFDAIYSMADPRGYFSVLGALDYMIPDIAEPVLRQILAARMKQYPGKPRLLDVGCSYGINAAVHRFPVNFIALRGRYSRHEMSTLSADEMRLMDRHFYASWPDVGLARFLGLDISAPAIEYAKAVGLIDDGIVADLETGPLLAGDTEKIRDVDVILATGCVGYVTDNTYRRLLAATRRPPWIVSFVLRMFPYERLAKTFAEHGLVTERLAGVVFAQRRFRDVEEFERSLKELGDRGVDTAGFEAEGLLQAELYLSRPESDIRAASLDDIVTVTSGRCRPTAARFVQVGTDGETQIALEA